MLMPSVQICGRHGRQFHVARFLTTIILMIIFPLTWGMKPHIRGFCSPRRGGISCYIFDSVIIIVPIHLTQTKSTLLKNKIQAKSPN